MNDAKSLTRYTGVDRRAPRAEPGVAKPGTPVPREVYRTGGPGGRHAAITNSLYNWHSYKSWADKIRGSWEEKK